MPIIDYIDVIDDIIDLSSDEETVRQGHMSFVIAGEERQDVHSLQDVLVEAAEGTQEATESGNTAKTTTSSSVATLSKGPPDTVATPNYPPTTTQTCPPTAVPFPSPSSTTPKPMTFEGNDGKLLRVKKRRTRKNYHTETPKRSHRLEEKHKGSNKSVPQLAVDRQISRMLEPAEEPATSTSNAESSETLSTSPTNQVCSLNMIAHETDLMLKKSMSLNS